MNQIKYIKEISLGILVIGLFLMLYFGVLRDPENDDKTEDIVTLEALIDETSQTSEKEEIEGDETAPSQEESSQEVVDIVVDVKGAVKLPDVFTFASDQRVIDAIEAAGGLTENADTKHINFAQLLEDEMYVYIPEAGEDITGMFGAPGSPQSQETIVDINKADESELLQLEGIGPSKASGIMNYREDNGPFQSIEELKNVSGIGDKTFERIKETITAK